MKLICIECRKTFDTPEEARAHTDPFVTVKWKDGQKVRSTQVEIPTRKHVAVPLRAAA